MNLHLCLDDAVLTVWLGLGPKNHFYVATNTAGNCSEVSFENLILSPQHGWRCLVLFPFKHSSRCPDVSLTTPGFIATNKAENCTAVSLRTPIKNAAFSNPIAKNLHSVTLPNGETTVPCLQPWSVAYQTWSSVTPPPSSSPPGHKHVT